MGKYLLKLMLFFITTFKLKEVDVKQLKAIVSTKLLLDQRRVPPTWKQKQRKESTDMMLVSLIVYAIMGLFVGLAIMQSGSLVLGMIILHGYLMFMLVMALITDFSTVMLDKTDAQIIIPKPVSGKTYMMARLVHVLIYLLQTVMALVALPFLFALLKYGGVMVLGLLLTIPLTVLFAVFITYLLYGIIIRFTSEQKLKDIIAYMQIFMTVAAAVSYQVLPRLINWNQLDTLFTLHWYSYLLPPVWMALFLEMLVAGIYDYIHIIMAVVAVIVPLVMYWVTTQYLSKGFVSKLQATDTGKQDKAVIPSKKETKGWVQKLALAFTGNAAEAASFLQAWKITARDKNFKMQFYPMLAYIPVLLFVFIYKVPKDGTDFWTHLPKTGMYLVLVYIAVLSSTGLMKMITFNENYNAAWIYQSAPIRKPGWLLSGAFKAMMIKFFAPIYLLLFAAGLAVWGYRIVDDFIFGFFNNIFLVLAITHLSKYILPFSKQPNVKEQMGRLVMMILQLIVSGILILVHYLALRVDYLIMLLIPVFAAACWWALRKLQQVPWRKIAV